MQIHMIINKNKENAEINYKERKVKIKQLAQFHNFQTKP